MDEDNVLGCILGLLVIFTLPISSIAYGYTLSVLWKWYVVKIFALPTLSIPLAIGLSMTIRFITHQHIDCEEKKEESWKKMGKLLLTPFFNCGFTLAIAWIVLKFV